MSLRSHGIRRHPLRRQHHLHHAQQQQQQQQQQQPVTRVNDPYAKRRYPTPPRRNAHRYVNALMKYANDLIGSLITLHNSSGSRDSGAVLDGEISSSNNQLEMTELMK